MTATPSIELPAWMAEQFSGQSGPAAADGSDLRRGVGVGQTRSAAARTGSAALTGGTFVTATGGGVGTPGPAASSWRCRSCGAGSYFHGWLLERRRGAEFGACQMVVATSYPSAGNS
jgi:hypothetical protein